MPAASFTQHADGRAGIVQPAVLVRRRRLPLRHRRRPEHGDDPACRPNQLFAISLTHPVLDRERWEPVLERRPGAAADTGRPAVARAGTPGLQVALLWRPALARRGLSPGNGLGLAGRAVRGCLAEGVPGRPAGARQALSGFEAHLGELAWARSARSSTPSRRTPHAAASPRPGAWPRCCVPWPGLLDKLPDVKGSHPGRGACAGLAREGGGRWFARRTIPFDAAVASPLGRRAKSLRYGAPAFGASSPEPGASSRTIARQTKQARRRLRIRSASRLVFPAASRRATYAWVSASTRNRTIAMP